METNSLQLVHALGFFRLIGNTLPSKTNLLRRLSLLPSDAAAPAALGSRLAPGFTGAIFTVRLL